MEVSSSIFVAGGTGMVGSAVVRSFLEAGYNRIVASCHSRAPEPAAGVRWVRLDLRRQADTEAFFDAERPEYVVLAAAKVGGILANSTYRADFIVDNLAIALNVISSAHRYGAVKLLNLGSSCIYPRLAPQPLKEPYLLTGELEPTNEPYAIAKIAAIKLCSAFNAQHGTNYLSAMPCNLYGPGDNYNLETAHVLPALIRKFHLGKLLAAGDYGRLAADIAANPLGFGLDREVDPAEPGSIVKALERLGVTGERITLWGTGEPYREFLYVDDLAAAVRLLVERYDSRETGEFVNVGVGEDRKISEIARVVREIVGYRGEIAYDASKPDGMPRKVLDTARMGGLGWRAATGLSDGIGKAYAWYTGRN
jgi:GDP-L-fucose synthase